MKIIKLRGNSISFLSDIDALKTELAKPYADNVYCKGGAGRIALMSYLGLYEGEQLRDSDFAFIGAEQDTPCQDDLDFEGETLEEYFNSRDTAINEVLLRPDCLIFTDRAVEAMTSGVIDTSEEDLSSRLLSRFILFAVRYNYSFSHDVDLERLYDFDVLVALLKAYELGVELEFLRAYQELDYYTDMTIADFVKYLLSSVYGFKLYDREDSLVLDLLHVDVADLAQDYPSLTAKVKSAQLCNGQLSMSGLYYNQIKRWI
jgi:hypothetical protein